MRTSNITCQGQRDTETGEPDDAISIKSGSEGGWEKRPAMDLARSLPNLFTLANLRAAPAEGQDNADLALLGLDEPVARVTSTRIAPNQSRRCALASVTPGGARSMSDGNPPVGSTSCPATSWTNCASRRCRGKALGGSEPE